MTTPKHLTSRFSELIELTWTEFRLLEDDPELSSSDAALLALIRACVNGSLSAMKLAFDRLDGRVAQGVEVQLPTFYTLYPYATSKSDDSPVGGGTVPISPSPAEGSPPLASPPPQGEISDEPLPSGSLRAVLERMLPAPRTLVQTILASVKALDEGTDTPNNPLVKSAMVAGLLLLVQRGKIAAVTEVFDQIDGKVKEVIMLLGDDVYVTSYETIAPAHAVKNRQGIYQVENKQTTTIWGERLEGGRGRQLHR